ncbi:hypothetical protein IKG45_01135 [Candidatus Saccharibacteria bacterium]|nr:hypothetical protein [Candidatus Saccharibacteria bacterium]
MTTVIEIWGLFKTGDYCEEENPEEGFRKFISALFCSEDVLIEKDLGVVSGKVLYDVEHLITIRHNGILCNKTFKDVAFILSEFCSTGRIKDEKGKELAYFTDSN